MTLSRRSTIKAIGVVGTGAALSGSALAVSEHEDDERDPEAVPDDEELGAIRVGHFSPDAPNVDVYVDDQQILSDVGYDELSPYLEIVPGNYTLTITAAGDDEPVYEETIVVGTDYYTAAAIGEIEPDEPTDDEPTDETVDDEAEEPTAESPMEEDDETDPDVEDDDDTEEVEDDEPEPAVTTPGTFEVLLLFDAEPDEVEAETSQIRLLHASPDAPAVDVAADGMALFENATFSEPSGYIPVEPGSRTLEIFEAGEVDLNMLPEDEEEEVDPEDEDDELEDDDDLEDEDDEELEDDDDLEEDDAAEDDEAIGQPDPVATVDIDLEEETAYTAFAIGYLGEADGEDDDLEDEDDAVDDTDDRPFDVRLAVDGTEEEDVDEAPDETEPDEEMIEEDEPEDDDLEDEDDTEALEDDDDEDDYDTETEEEPMTADD